MVAYRSADSTARSSSRASRPWAPTSCATAGAATDADDATVALPPRERTVCTRPPQTTTASDATAARRESRRKGYFAAFSSAMRSFAIVRFASVSTARSNIWIALDLSPCLWLISPR